MIREVCSIERVSTRDNVNRDYPLTGWMALPPHSWKAPGAGCIYRRGKKKTPTKWWHKWMALSGVSSLFSITGLSLLVPVPAFVWHLQLEATYLSGCCGIHWRALWTFMQRTTIFSAGVRGWKVGFRRLFFFLAGCNVYDELWGVEYKPMLSCLRHNI